MCDIGIMAWYAGYLKIYSLFTAECSRNGIRKCIKKREEKQTDQTELHAECNKMYKRTNEEEKITVDKILSILAP